MFDAIDLEEAISDIYDVGVDDDSLNLIYEANKEIQMAVRTPSGLTERQTVKNIVLQGDTWGSILASVQVDTIGKAVEEAGLGYMYKEVLPVSLLGLVDDLIGVTDAGYKAAQLNALINEKSAAKCLQFGVKKCKSMFVGKSRNSVMDGQLFVDKWDVVFEDNLETGVEELIETHAGQTPIGNTQEQKYLGFVLSGTGDNMANIRAIKNKSIGIIRKIMNKLNCLNLLDYYFECALIFLKVMLRASILYACEAYYNLTEVQIRQIERIEEGYLRQVLKTARGCPIVQMYLEVGLVPARFEVQRLRLLYLKNILEQNESSMTYKFLFLQIKSPTRGDWFSTCQNDLKLLRFEGSLEEIKLMTKTKFNRILKERINENALRYLTGKQGTKGKQIRYSDIEMAEYLMPGNKLSIEQKRRIFEIRNGMVDIPSNFSHGNKSFYCFCGEREDTEHIYICKSLNKNKSESINFGMLYNGCISEQICIYKRFEENFKQREELMNKNENQTKQTKETQKKRKKPNPPCDPIVDPLYCKRFSYG